MWKNPVFVILLLVMSASCIFSASFELEKTKTADGEDFLFPTDALREGSAIFALTMGKDRSNGEIQQKEVTAWQQHFNDNPDLLGSVPVYHFSVLSGIPFFVKGPIRKALYEYYADIVDPSKVGVLFVSKTEKFTQKAELPFDDESILVVVSSDSTIVGFVKGSITPGKVEQLQKLLIALP